VHEKHVKRVGRLAIERQQACWRSRVVLDFRSIYAMSLESTTFFSVVFSYEVILKIANYEF